MSEFHTPRGGLDPDWQEAWMLVTRKYRKLVSAARRVVRETDRIHDNEPWPIKYRAPYEAITKLREALPETYDEFKARKPHDH